MKRENHDVIPALSQIRATPKRVAFLFSPQSNQPPPLDAELDNIDIQIKFKKRGKK
jgi:hypothetical protein